MKNKTERESFKIGLRSIDGKDLSVGDVVYLTTPSRVGRGIILYDSANYQMVIHWISIGAPGEIGNSLVLPIQSTPELYSRSSTQ